MCLSAVRSLYDYLVFEGEVRVNPVDTGKLKLKLQNRLPGFLTPLEKERVLDWMKTKPRHVELAFRMMFATGLRVSECVALAPGDVKVIEHSYLVQVREGKGNRERLAPVVDRQTAFDLVEFAQKRMGQERLFGVALFTLSFSVTLMITRRYKNGSRFLKRSSGRLPERGESKPRMRF